MKNKKSIIIILLVCIIAGFIAYFVTTLIHENLKKENNSSTYNTSTYKLQNPYEKTNKLDGVYTFKDLSKDEKGHIYNTIGVFQFKDGDFIVKYYLNDHYNSLEETSGVFGYRGKNLMLEFENYIEWHIIEEGDKFLCKGHFSTISPINESFTLTPVVNTTIEDVLEKLKLEIATDELYFNENIRWLMAKEEIEDITNQTTSNIDSNKSKSINYATIKHDRYNNPFNIKETVYIFYNKQLKAYWYSFVEEGSSYDNYKKIYDILSSKYGEPTTENYNWIDPTYKDNPEKWNDAFRYYDFTITTTWEDNEDFYIEMSWDYNATCHLVYCEKGYEIFL